MSNKKTGDGAALFLIGATLGTAAGLLIAPAAGIKTRRKLTRKGEEAANYLIGAGKELVEKCEDLYERSGELAGGATHELSAKYRALRDQSEQLLSEAETILHRAKNALAHR